MDQDEPAFKREDRIVVVTSDGHRFEGRFLGTRTSASGQRLAVLRLDSGWEVTYPLSMIHPLTGHKASD